MLKRWLCFVLGVCLPLGASAQSHLFNLDSDFFARGEIRKGGTAQVDPNDPQGDFAAFLLGRARVAADYQLFTKKQKEKPLLELNVSGQFCGTWGMGYPMNFEAYEAWAAVNFGPGFFAKLGRQALSYDDQRVFGSDDWSLTGLSHDALKLGYEGHGHKVHAFGAFNQNPENMNGGTYYANGLQPYKAMAALWYHWDMPWIPLGVSLLGINLTTQAVSTTEEKMEGVFNQQMFGGYLLFHPDKWEVDAAGYYQMGKEEHGLPIQAWMASGKVSFTASKQWKIYGGYDYLSGDTDFAVPPGHYIGMQRHEVIRGFSLLYGSHHKFYGAMDFFYLSDYYGGFTPGLQNAYLGAKWSPVSQLKLDLGYHFLATAAKLRNADPPLGHEVEFSASYDLGHTMSISLGYTFMRGTKTMEVLKRTSGKRELHWAWIMFQASPRFLQAKR